LLVVPDVPPVVPVPWSVVAGGVLVPLVVEEASSFLQAASAKPPTRASTVRTLIDILIREPPD
jgi:hypothetical protein